uniref:Protein kinase domain-containing protein n=1 Tax=Moniliophthora roreri TaxID=221103 RepID=A0A0W0F8I0_MONRR
MTSGEELTNPKEREAIGDLLAREHSPYERAAPVQEGSTIANEESSSIDPVSFFRDHATELQRISFILPDPNIDIRSLSTGGTLYLVETANNALKETSEVLLRGLGYLAKLHPLHVIQRIAGLFQNHVTSPHQSKPQRWDDLAMRIHIWLAMVQVLDLRFIDGISEEAFRSIEAILLDIESDLELAARFLKKDPGCTYLGVRLPLACHQKDLEKWLRLFKWTESKSRLQEMMAFQSGDAAVTPFDVAVLFDTPARMSFAPSIVITPKLHPLLQIWTSKRLAIDFAESRFHPVEFDQYSNVFYDVLEGTLREEVIVPSLSRITVIINEIRQWPVEVYGGQSRVSLEGLLSGVYHALRANAWKQDYDGLDEQAAKETAKAFYERCRTLRSTLGDEGVKREIARGLRRIDFLRGKTKFGGAVLENDHDNVVVRKIFMNTGEREALRTDNGKQDASKAAEPKAREIKTLEDLRAVLTLPDEQALTTLFALDSLSAPLVVQLLQMEAHQTASTDGYRKRCLRCLRVLVKKYHVLPPSLFLNNITREGTQPLRGGGFADIFKGRFGDRPVCLKVLRTHVESDQRKRKRVVADFCQEAVLWTQLEHPNVLPFLGVNTEEFAPGFCLISPWMMNGDIVSYLKEDPGHDRLKSIHEIASGLAYLHSLTPMIIHGDIKGANILVDDHFKCCLADFGLAAVAGETQLMNSTTSGAIKGSLRWMAPEMYTSIGTPNNNAGLDKSPRDVYAYACTILEIMTCRVPFSDLIEPAVIFQVVRGVRPERPAEGWCPDHIWNLVELCWAEDAARRPRAIQIEQYLKRLSDSRIAESEVLFDPAALGSSGVEPCHYGGMEKAGNDLEDNDASDDEVSMDSAMGSDPNMGADSPSSSADAVCFFRERGAEVRKATSILPDPSIDIRGMNTEHAQDLIDSANSSLSETLEVVLGALDCIGKLHSFRIIQRVIVLFTHHITPYYRMRSSQWDILALKIQIQMAMMELFALRFIDRLENLEDQGGPPWIVLQGTFVRMETDLENASGFLQTSFESDRIFFGCFDLCRRFALHQKILKEHMRPLTHAGSSDPIHSLPAYPYPFHPVETTVPYFHPWLDHAEVQRQPTRLSVDFAYRYLRPVEIHRAGSALLLRDMSYEKLSEQATILGLFNMTVTLDEIQQWPIQINGKQPQAITLWDLLSGMYEALRRRVTRQDYDRLSERDAKEISKAFYARCEAFRSSFGDKRVEAEIADGLKRVDFLKGRTKLGWAMAENDSNGHTVIKLTSGEGYVALYQ